MPFSLDVRRIIPLILVEWTKGGARSMGRLNVFKNHLKSAGLISVHMVIDMLHDHGYEIMREAPVNTRNINRSLMADAHGLLSGPKSETPGSGAGAVLYLYASEALTAPRSKSSGSPSGFSIQAPAIVVCSCEDEVERFEKLLEDSHDQASQITLVMKTRTNASPLIDLGNLVGNFILSVNGFAASCHQAMSNAGSFQGLVDAAQDYFGAFINITDEHGALLACTTEIEPIDPINKQLVEQGYFSNESVPKDELKNGFLPGRIVSRSGIHVDSLTTSENLDIITYVIRVHGQYFAHVAMECAASDLTQGLIDAFEIFTSCCDKFATMVARHLVAQDFGTGNFMRNLLVEENIDSAFLFDQAEKNAIPTTGHFILVAFAVDYDFRDQLRLFLQKVDAYIMAPHQTFLYESLICVLLHSEAYRPIADEFNRLYDFSFQHGEHVMYASDVYLNLSETYLAGKEIEAIRKYQGFVEHVRLCTNSKKQANVFVFLDAFSFYWSDPVADRSIRAFSIERTLINRIARDDRANETDHLVLLNAYLINDGKAAAIADRFHMHRNGIQYRIDKIAKLYDIDLDDYVTRQYLQAAARVQMIASGRFIQQDLDADSADDA